MTIAFIEFTIVFRFVIRTFMPWNQTFYATIQ